MQVLEECMSKCGPKFRNEIGKFRFLNELIRLVSPQYDGDKTPKKIRDKILDLMLLWTVNFPHEKKIKEAYDMLLKRGVRHETAKPVVVQNNNIKSTEAEVKMREKAEPDLAAKLQRLLRSSNPADHKAANLLIQNMVKEVRPPIFSFSIFDNHSIQNYETSFKCFNSLNNRKSVVTK